MHAHICHSIYLSEVESRMGPREPCPPRLEGIIHARAKQKTCPRLFIVLFARCQQHRSRARGKKRIGPGDWGLTGNYHQVTEQIIRYVTSPLSPPFHLPMLFTSVVGSFKDINFTHENVLRSFPLSRQRAFFSFLLSGSLFFLCYLENGHTTINQTFKSTDKKRHGKIR